MRFGFLAVTALLLFSSPVFAADEFGERFSGQEPAGFSDPVAPVLANEVAPQDIEPAAGEANESKETFMQNEERLEMIKPKAKPARVEAKENLQ